MWLHILTQPVMPALRTALSSSLSWDVSDQTRLPCSSLLFSGALELLGQIQSLLSVLEAPAHPGPSSPLQTSVPSPSQPEQIVSQPLTSMSPSPSRPSRPVSLVTLLSFPGWARPGQHLTSGAGGCHTDQEAAQAACVPTGEHPHYVHQGRKELKSTPGRAALGGDRMQTRRPRSRWTPPMSSSPLIQQLPLG